MRRKRRDRTVGEGRQHVMQAGPIRRSGQSTWARALRARAFDRNPIRGRHYGQRPPRRIERPDTWLPRPPLHSRSRSLTTRSRPHMAPRRISIDDRSRTYRVGVHRSCRQRSLLKEDNECRVEAPTLAPDPGCVRTRADEKRIDSHFSLVSEHQCIEPRRMACFCEQRGQDRREYGTS